MGGWVVFWRGLSGDFGGLGGVFWGLSGVFWGLGGDFRELGSDFGNALSASYLGFSFKSCKHDGRRILVIKTYLGLPTNNLHSAAANPICSRGT